MADAVENPMNPPRHHIASIGTCVWVLLEAAHQMERGDADFLIGDQLASPMSARASSASVSWFVR
jgi:hypothetical protein